MKNKIILLFILINVQAFAQEPVKRVLSIDDYADWKTLNNPQISDNGKYISYEVNPQKGDGNLIFYSDQNVDTISRGYSARFGSENNVLVFKIKQPESVIRKAKKDKVKKDKMPADSLGIYNIKDKSVNKFPNLKSFKIPEENASWIAFLAKPEEAPKDTSKNSEVKKGKKQPGNDLILYDISNSDTMIVKNVTEYFYAKKGSAVYFITQKKDSVKTYSKLNLFNTADKTIENLYATEGWIKKITCNEVGEDYAFLYSQDTIKEKNYSLYLGENKLQPKKIVDDFTTGIPVGWSPSENGRIYFSEDGTKLFLGTAELVEPAQKDTLLDEDKPKLDIWNWKDKKLQPQQLVEASKEKKRSFLAVYHLEQNRFVQLADVNVQQVSAIQKGNGEIGLGYDDSSYLRSSSWTGERNRDYFLVDFMSGIKRNILNKKSYARLSPQGKYIIWWEPSDSSFYSKSTNVKESETVSLTKIIPVAFYDELNDRPTNPSPYGIAGWSPDDRYVFIYDRYDIWKMDASGERVPVCITKAFGRRNDTRLRYLKLDNELEYIPTNEEVLLSAVNEKTMSRGYFSMQFNTIKDPQLLVMGNVIYNQLKKAKNAERLIFTKEDVSKFPDLWRGNLEFRYLKKISEVNPQQKTFIWPTVELVSWNSFSGEELKGLLYKPENLDPNKKYPMVVYFYERNSELLNRYQQPAPSRSTINKAFYTSNGYLVFVPDITYKNGYPGQSAYNAIVSGTQYLINNFSFVDKNKIGLQGQSWGGYQTAYLITQTDMYAAAMAGAPVSNMTSAYGGIRWQSGMSRMFQYEHTQSRIGGTLWEKPLQYLENSPVFYAPKINTPLLMMHNDNDGAVPWYQGIEMFVALRRLDKPAWLLTYNGEPHNLKASSWANRIDLSKRMFQFFNHYLKGEPAPVWIEKGVPAIEKGETLGY